MNVREMEMLAQFNAGHITVMTTLIGLLIDKGLVTREEIIARYSRLRDETMASAGGEPMLQATEAVLSFVAAITPPGRKPGSH
jgi:hypothetical protein